MAQIRHIARIVKRTFPFIHGQYLAGVKRSNLNCDGVLVNSASNLRQRLAWTPPWTQQMRFASGEDKNWYDWYARLGVHPRASKNEIRKAFLKRAKVEHPDHDKSPGAKERFFHLQDTYEKLCDDSKREMHDQERLVRQKTAEAQMMAREPSIADSLRAKWKAEEEDQRQAEEMRMRDARKTAQEVHPQPKPAKAYGSTADTQGFKADSHGSKAAGTKQPKKTTEKWQRQQQTQSPLLRLLRLRRQKMADDLSAKRKAAADKMKREQDAAAKKARERERLQERLVVIRGLGREIQLIDLFEPLIVLTPGAVFDARILPDGWGIATVEFCKDDAARRVLAHVSAEPHGLMIKGKRVTNVQLHRSGKKIPVTGLMSRVVILRGWGPGVELGVEVKGTSSYLNGIDGSLDDFLSKRRVRVERILSKPHIFNTCTVRLASWADAERAKRLLHKQLPGLQIVYGPDPCETKGSIIHLYAGYLRKSNDLVDTERDREQLVHIVVEAFETGLVFLVLCAFAIAIWQSLEWPEAKFKRNSSDV
ncbi:hypothetical protein Daus18300_009700 [Diaporthe australafricana]|uniref:J domain-containing protein n=1 Tax=Diaporthe australafricana TaxID=127596 RepID=A0ABR3WDR2_9PEZI